MFWRKLAAAISFVKSNVRHEELREANIKLSLQFLRNISVACFTSEQSSQQGCCCCKKQPTAVANQIVQNIHQIDLAGTRAESLQGLA